MVAVVIVSGLLVWVDANYRTANRASNQKLALMIAEAGIEYYRWHLAHALQDFRDGTGQAGPYSHDYKDKNGNVVGQFILEITPPPVASSVVVLKSTGKVNADPGIEKSVRARLGIPSVIKYAVLSNKDIRFEPATHVVGPVHANGGIHFDGIAENLVTSSRTAYNDPDHSGSDEYAVHTHTAPVDPLPPASLPVRSDVFYTGRQLSLPVVDFKGITESLALIKSRAQSGGRYFGRSGNRGYHIVLKDNDTFDIYKVRRLVRRPRGCNNRLRQTGWMVWSIRDTSGSETFVGNYPIPANGLIFVEDHVWVDGKINTARLTIASGRMSADKDDEYTNIIVNKDITYTNYDGQDVIGLIGQGNITVGMVSEDDLRIDAAMVAQNGRVGRYYYRPSSDSMVRCSPYHSRLSILLFGAIATNNGYGFAYTDGTGYQTRDIIFDSNLIYNPPPGFPLTSAFYEQISWEEIK